jgi:4-amino-4-deoxy-L-arabinose transferase-like glycosyltransferase
MSKQKTIKAKQKQSSQTGTESGSTALAGVLKNETVIDYILLSLTIAYFIFYIFKLYSLLGITFFWADENVHAFISSIILKTKSLPAVLPDDIYGGFEYSYPPFFHILSAFVIATGGFAALKFTNLILLILFLIGFYFSIRKYYGISEALVACLLISLSPIVAVNSIRFMTEMLSMLLIFGSFFFLVMTIKSRKILFAIISGLSTGLLLLSKQIGIVVLGFYFLLLVWFFFQRKKDVKLLLYVIGTAVCVYTPYLIWAIYNGVEVFGFLSIFFGTKPEWTTNAIMSFRKSESTLKEFAYLFYTGNGIVITTSLLIPLYYFIRTRGRDFPHNCIFLMTVYLAAVMVIWHITNSRHTITLLPLITFLCGYAVRQIVTNKIAIRATILLLLIIAGIQAYKMPNYRPRYNPPVALLDIAAVIEKDYSSDGRTLVIHAFDILMYTRKPVIWPYPNLRNTPIDLFAKQPSDKLYVLLKQYNINFILIDTRHIAETEDFTGLNYPLPFVRNCEKLDQQGKLSLKAISDSKYFILLEVI